MFKLTWKQFEKDIVRLAKKVKDEDFSGILAVAAGGVVPAYFLSKILGIPRIETITLKSYLNQEKNEVKIFNQPTYSKKDKILVIDDLIDSGDTMKVIRKKFPKAKVLVLYIKGSKNQADYYLQRKAKDEWIVFPWELDEKF